MGALKNNRGPRLKSLNEISDGLIESILKITDDPIQVKDQITGDLVAIFSILYIVWSLIISGMENKS